MGEFSNWHWLLVLLVVLLLFGGGKISGLLGDLAKSIKTFRQHMSDDEDRSNDGGVGKQGSMTVLELHTPTAKTSAARNG